MEPFKVMTWNTARRANPAMVALVAREQPDVLFLQEVTLDTWPVYSALEGWTGLAFGLDRRARADGDGRDRSLGAAILTRGREPLTSWDVLTIEGVAQPERVVTAMVAAPCCKEPMTLLAYHALNGRKGEDGFAKPRTTQAVGRWLGQQTGPVIAGMDANSPDIDHPDETQVVCHFQGDGPEVAGMEQAMLGPNPAHGLRDVWRTFLREHPGQAKPLYKHQPSGPLAVTHFTGGHRARYPVRFDHIWATSDFEVMDVKHLHEGFTVGSDHAAVIAVLRHQPPGLRLVQPEEQDTRLPSPARCAVE